MVERGNRVAAVVPPDLVKDLNPVEASPAAEANGAAGLSVQQPDKSTSIAL